MTKTAASPSFKKGDTVEWGTSQGKTEGKVVKKVTGEAHVQGHAAHASKEAPQYEVESAKTGKHAIHKPEALHKKKTGSAD